jgi:hypothetical protein
VVVQLRTDYPGKLPSPLYIPLTATLLDPRTKQPVPESYTVSGIATNPNQAAKDQYDFAYPYGAIPGSLPGVYHGVVIVPVSGHYTVIVNAFNTKDANTAKLPTALGSGQLAVDVSGPPLASANQPSKVRRADVWEVVLLAVHSVAALSWFALAGLFAFLALPSRRRFVSDRLSDLLDRNVGRFAQAFLWSTIFVWATGLLNLKKAVAYAPPLSGAQATKLFRLPYARPYTIALYTKIGMFVLMSVLAVALVREARRRAAEVEDARWLEEKARDTSGPKGSASAPPTRDAEAVAAVRGSPRPGPVATVDRPAPGEIESAPPYAGLDRPPRLALSARVAIAALAIGGPVILICVTVLKYTHILSEQLRALR